MSMGEDFPHEIARKLYEARQRYRERHLDPSRPFGTLDTDAHLRWELKEAERRLISAISRPMPS